MGRELLRSIGTGLSIGSQAAQGFDANAQAKANAAIDKLDAASTMAEARRRAHEIQRRGRARAGQQKAMAAASGFTQEGTSLVLQIDELLAAQFNANEEIRVGRAGENRLMQSAAANVRRGKTARNVGLIGALGMGVGALGSKVKRDSIDATT